MVFYRIIYWSLYSYFLKNDGEVLSHMKATTLLAFSQQAQFLTVINLLGITTNFDFSSFEFSDLIFWVPLVIFALIDFILFSDKKADQNYSVKILVIYLVLSFILFGITSSLRVNTEASML